MAGALVWPRASQAHAHRLPAVREKEVKKLGQPIEHKHAYNEAIERELNAWLNEALFTPLFLLLRDEGVPLNKRYRGIEYDETSQTNAVETSAIAAALASGKLQYANGVFSGQLSAHITKELRAIGARYNFASGTFRIAKEDIPLALRGQLADAQRKSAVTHAAMLALLAVVIANLKFTLTITTTETMIGRELTTAVGAVIVDLNRQLDRQIKTLYVPKALERRMEDLKAAAKSKVENSKLRDNAVEQMAKRLEEYALKTAKRLDQKTRENLAAGARLDQLGKIYEAQVGQAQRRAGSMARNSMGLTVGEYRLITSKAMGNNDYIWRTMGDERVRPTPDYPLGNHRVLDNKKFSWDAPPVTVPSTGSRAHPGQDPECRCWAIPIFLLPDTPT